MMTSPTVLARLGWFLMEARGRQANKTKDVIMISPPNADKMCLVLGVVAQSSAAPHQGNPFGPAFRSAAEDTEAQTQLDGFDSSVLLVSLPDCGMSWPCLLQLSKTSMQGIAVAGTSAQCLLCLCNSGHLLECTQCGLI